MIAKNKVEEAEKVTNTNPTENQKKVGNYKKGKVTIKGLKITIENPIGSTRSGIDDNGNEWSIEMKYTYGYFNGTIGKDGDQIDVFIGPNVDEDDFFIYIIDQVDPETKAFDEHKVMFGFSNIDEAKEAYNESYDEDWKGFGSITTLSLSKFKKWIKNKDAIKYPAKKLNMSSKIDFKNESNIDDDSTIKVIRLLGEVVEGSTLLNLKEQAGDSNDFDKLIVEIASPGGSVSEGLEIMVWLDNLSKEGKQIITVVVANAYSIASLIMLAADIKLISVHGKVMVHNPMVPELQYVNANDLEEYVASLRDLESLMYELYEMFTGLKTEQIKALMDNETYLSPQEAVDNGFADMVVDIKPKPYEAVTNLKREISMQKTLNILNKVIGMVNKSEFINQLYSDDAGNEIEIFQGDQATYKVGDRTSVETSGEDGIKLSDGSKLTIEDFVITEIDRSTEVEEITEDKEGADEVINDPATEVEKEVEKATGEFNEGPAPKEEKAAEEIEVPVKSKDEMPAKVVETVESTKTTKETVATQITQISKWESDVINDTFELDTKVEYAPYEEGGESYSVGAGEWQLEDGRVVLTDSEGIIRYIKDGVTEDAQDTEDKPEAKVEVEAKDSDEVAKIKEEMTSMKGDITEMKSLMKAIDNKFENVEKFEQKAAEAIDTIASNTSSSFKPNAKSVAKESISAGSIFKNAMAKAGLSK